MVESTRPEAPDDSSSARYISSSSSGTASASSNTRNIAPSASSDEKVRLAVLTVLLKKPQSLNQLCNRTPYSSLDLEPELRLLITEGWVIPRDRKFFVRNKVKALAFVNLDRRYIVKNSKDSGRS
jgi:hypothetical protein